VIITGSRPTFRKQLHSQLWQSKLQITRILPIHFGFSHYRLSFKSVCCPAARFPGGMVRVLNEDREVVSLENLFYLNHSTVGAVGNPNLYWLQTNLEFGTQMILFSRPLAKRKVLLRVVLLHASSISSSVYNRNQMVYYKYIKPDTQFWAGNEFYILKIKIFKPASNNVAKKWVRRTIFTRFVL